MEFAKAFLDGDCERILQFDVEGAKAIEAGRVNCVWLLNFEFQIATEHVGCFHSCGCIVVAVGYNDRAAY